MIYESNITQVVENLKLKILNKEAQDKLALEIALMLYSSNIRRIMNEGLDLGMSRIGVYSTKPFYLNPKNSPVDFKGQGKTEFAAYRGTSIGFGAKKYQYRKGAHITRYFPKGYWEFRGYIGRINDKVVFDLSHKLKNDWKIFQIPNGYQLGFQSLYGKDVSRGNERQFKTTVWGITRDDRKNIEKIIKEFYARA